MQRTAALNFGVDRRLEAHPTGHHEASAGIASGRNRARRTRGTREAVQVRSGADAGSQAISQYHIRAVGSGIGETEVVRGKLKGAKFRAKGMMRPASRSNGGRIFIPGRDEKSCSQQQ